jgi:hypothetical protein
VLAHLRFQGALLVGVEGEGAVMSPKTPTYGAMAEYLIRERGYVVLGFKSAVKPGFETRSLWTQEQPTHMGKFVIREETDQADWNEQKRILAQQFGALRFAATRPEYFYQAVQD